MYERLIERREGKGGETNYRRPRWRTSRDLIIDPKRAIEGLFRKIEPRALEGKFFGQCKIGLKMV